MAEFPHIFISADTRAKFEQALEDDRVSQYQIAFIEDTHEIWARGKYYPCPYTKTEIDKIIKDLQDSKVDVETYNAAIERLENALGELPAADEEDITVTADNKLQLKDRGTSKGMGYKILRLPEDGILTQDMIDEPNTIYEIRYNFDLNGQTVTIPKNCTLKFEGGLFSNGTIEVIGTNILSQGTGPILKVSLTGSVCCPLYPDWFGAVGDGIVDDTESLRQVICIASSLKCKVKFTNYKVYKVNGPLNYLNGEYLDVTLNLEGDTPAKTRTYTAKDWGGISMDSGTSLFKNAKISGSIISMIICGVRDESVHVFDNCTCRSLSIFDSTISNVGAVFFDSSLTWCSKVENNIFLTAFYFSRSVNTNPSIVDSNICGNYINGGAEPTANSCFEFGHYNGALIYDNFIDYYRTIYNVKAAEPQSGGNINSQNNHYQVFKYLWNKDKINNLSIHSVGDCFNWNDESKLEKLTTYEPIQYEGRDGATYDLPSHIIRIEEVTQISFINSVFEANIKNILYIKGGLYNYNNSVIIESPLVSSGSMIPILPNGSLEPVYNGGNFKYKKVILPDATIEAVDQLPSLSEGWSSRMVGQKVLCDNIVYTAKFIFDSEKNTYKAVWVPRNTNPWRIIR